MGAHLGLGYVWQATDAVKVDFHGKWLWTRLYGGDARVADDPYCFDDVDSYRLRLGARVDWSVTDYVALYAGLAWEREFDGEARATTYGYDTPSPTVRGDSAVLDLGVAVRSDRVPGLSMEMGATATLGKRHGVMGNLLVRYEF